MSNDFSTPHSAVIAGRSSHGRFVAIILISFVLLVTSVLAVQFAWATAKANLNGIEPSPPTISSQELWYPAAPERRIEEPDLV